MGFCYGLAGFVPSVAALFLSGENALPLLKDLLGFAVVAWMFDHLSIGERCQMTDTEVNPDILVASRQFLRLIHLTGERDVPLIHFTFDGTGFDLALERPVDTYFYLANLA